METDAPFLTPMPLPRAAQRVVPVPLTMRAMAEVRGEDLGALCAAVDANTSGGFRHLVTRDTFGVRHAA